jgi:hypothetical protein
MKTNYHFGAGKKIWLLLSLAFSLKAHSNVPPTNIDYAVVFGTCFEKDIVSLSINKHVIFSNYKLGFEKALMKGNLSLQQSGKWITVSYNGGERKRSRIKTNSLLKIEIILNGKVSAFEIDLRKGNILLVEFCPTAEIDPTTRKLTIEQRQEAVILM